jgi:hypothetical protein
MIDPSTTVIEAPIDVGDLALNNSDLGAHRRQLFGSRPP